MKLGTACYVADAQSNGSLPCARTMKRTTRTTKMTRMTRMTRMKMRRTKSAPEATAKTAKRRKTLARSARSTALIASLLCCSLEKLVCPFSKQRSQFVVV